MIATIISTCLLQLKHDIHRSSSLLHLVWATFTMEDKIREVTQIVTLFYSHSLDYHFDPLYIHCHYFNQR